MDCIFIAISGQPTLPPEPQQAHVSSNRGVLVVPVPSLNALDFISITSKFKILIIVKQFYDVCSQRAMRINLLILCFLLTQCVFFGGLSHKHNVT